MQVLRSLESAEFFQKAGRFGASKIALFAATFQKGSKQQMYASEWLERRGWKFDSRFSRFFRRQYDYEQVPGSTDERLWVVFDPVLAEDGNGWCSDYVPGGVYHDSKFMRL